MFAARYHPGDTAIHEERIAPPVPGPDQVLLRVKAAGVCHSDLHVLDGDYVYPNVFTMGHEACGELVAVGSAVPESLGLRMGALYVIHGPNPCGHCLPCRTGHDNLCNGEHCPIGIGSDGAYAEFIAVAARNVITVPAGVDPAVAAVATDAVLTPYHALKTIAGLRGGQRVLVIGLGGLGLNGVQIAHMLGSYVIASDLRETALDLARAMGADEVIAPVELTERLKANRVDIVVDFVGTEATFAGAMSVLAPRGLAVIVGLGARRVPLALSSLPLFETRIAGSMWGTYPELIEVLDHIAAGRLAPQVETQPMADVGHWLDELRHGRIRSRLALVPQ